MGTLSKVYVDPSLDADVGAGTIDDPYGDLRHAFASMIFDTTNGTQVLIKAGTTEYDADIPINCTPSYKAPLLIGRYGDGNNPVLNGMGGSTPIFNHWGGASHKKEYVHFADLHFTNVDAAYLVYGYSFMSAYRCEFSNSNGGGFGCMYAKSFVRECYFHDISGIGAVCLTAICNFFHNGENKKFSNAISVSNYTNAYVSRNFVLVDSSSNGTSGVKLACRICHNSIISEGGSGTGINGYFSNQLPYTAAIYNNLVEGFISGRGIAATYTYSDAFLVKGNAACNNGDDYYVYDELYFGSLDDPTDNENLTESPFAKTGTLPTTLNDPLFWDKVRAYFAPRDVGNVCHGAWPSVLGLSKGAIQANQANVTCILEDASVWE